MFQIGDRIIHCGWIYRVTGPVTEVGSHLGPSRPCVPVSLVSEDGDKSIGGIFVETIRADVWWSKSVDMNMWGWVLCDPEERAARPDNALGAIVGR